MSVLKETIEAIFGPGKGILAADESTGTAGKRLQSIGAENTEENRRAYRDLLITTQGAEEFVSGIILYEETLYQKATDGTSFVDVLNAKGILPGIKVDTGIRPFGGVNQFNTTQGFDNLSERCAQYFKDGARFTKWRSALEITEEMPSDLCIEENMRGQARYAAIAQENDLVPIVEPENLMTGSFTTDRYAEVTTKVLTVLFEKLKEFSVDLSTVILKTNMIVPSSEGGESATPEEVAKRTLEVLKAVVPAELGGIVFLSGGQTEQEALDNLREINAQADRSTDAPWPLTFSYGRALQASALKEWGGKPEKASAASQAYYKHAEALSAVVTHRA